MAKRKPLDLEWIVRSWGYAVKKSAKDGEPSVVRTMKVYSPTTKESKETQFYGYWDHFDEKLQSIATDLGINLDDYSTTPQVIKKRIETYRGKTAVSKDEKLARKVVLGITKYPLVTQATAGSTFTLDKDSVLTNVMSGSGDISWDKF
jgi:hypothetical protein